MPLTPLGCRDDAESRVSGGAQPIVKLQGQARSESALLRQVTVFSASVWQPIDIVGQ